MAIDGLTIEPSQTLAELRLNVGQGRRAAVQAMFIEVNMPFGEGRLPSPTYLQGV